MAKAIKTLTTFFLIVASFGYADPQTTLDIGFGYRRDDIQWKLSRETSPCREEKVNGRDVEDDLQITSRLDLEDLDIFLMSGKIRAMDCCYYFRGDASYGWICHGRGVEQLTVSFPNKERASIGRRFSDKIDDDYVVSGSALIGYPFYWCCNTYMIAPWIGYAYNGQRVRIEDRCIFLRRDGDDHRRDDDCRKECDDRHRGDFHFREYGPMIGFDTAIMFDDCWNVYGEFSWHFATEVKRRREAKFRIDGYRLHDFNHDSTTKNGWGFQYEVGANYFCSCWYVGVKTDYRYFRSNKSDNEMRLRSWGVHGVLGYLF